MSQGGGSRTATPAEEVKAAYHRWSLAKRDDVVSGSAQPAPKAAISVGEVCKAYLAKAKVDGSKKTFDDRNDTLWDFCRGFKSSSSPVPPDLEIISRLL